MSIGLDLMVIDANCGSVCGDYHRLLPIVAGLQENKWQDICRSSTVRNNSFFLSTPALLISAVILNIVRWNIITGQVERSIVLRTSIIGYFESMFYNQVLPTSIGSDTIRILRAYDVGARPGWAIVGVLIDRAFGLLAVASVIMSCRSCRTHQHHVTKGFSHFRAVVHRYITASRSAPI